FLFLFFPVILSLIIDDYKVGGNAAVHTSLSSGCVLPKAYPMTGYGDWYKVGSHCVKYFGSPLNFSAAEFRCRNKAPGGHLVSVHKSKANSDLLCFIGGFEIFRFIWTDGSSWNYQIWTLGEPNTVFSYKEDCVEMNWNCKVMTALTQTLGLD
uniref:C-type lectin domain-containing protein n=1 Tax=Cyprinus carpio TaxID=7962 RepID=A0A8C2FZR7_CYPCA